ncbi:hypothetical protein D3C77_122470 [compost metagenome]
MNRPRLRDHILNGPTPLMTPLYNFIYFFMFTLIIWSFLNLFAVGPQHLLDLTSENFAPKNILLMYYFVFASLAIHSVFSWPYENYKSRALKIICLYPANLWLSLLSSASGITVASFIVWYFTGQNELPIGLTNTDIFGRAILSLLAWPAACILISTLLLPRQYIESNEFINSTVLKFLIRAFTFFIIISALGSLLLVAREQ